MVSDHPEVYSEAREEGNLRKKQRDAARLEKLPSRETLRDAVRQAMFELAYLKELTRGQADLEPAERAAANALLLGILYHNNKAGRSGEWLTMRMATVRKNIVEDKLDYLLAAKQKSARKRGEAVKMLAGGTVEALKAALVRKGSGGHGGPRAPQAGPAGGRARGRAASRLPRRAGERAR